MKKRRTKGGSASLNRPVKKILMDSLSWPGADEVMNKLVATDASKRRLNKRALRKGVADTIDFLKQNDLDVIQKLKEVYVSPDIPADVNEKEENGGVIPQKLNATLYAASSKKVLKKKVKKVKKKRRVTTSNTTQRGMYMNGNQGDQDEPASYKVKRPSQRVSDLAGIDNVLTQIRELIQYPLLHPEIYETLQITPPRGVLLHGPPGCGKTLLATAIGGELGHTVQFFRLSAPEVVSWRSGDTERNIRALFKQAKECAPSLVFIDEIDAIAGKRTSGRGMDRRIVSQLLTAMDQIGEDEDEEEEEEEEEDNDDDLNEEKKSSNNNNKSSDADSDLNSDASSPSRKRKRKNSSSDHKKKDNKTKGSVLVIGATSRPEELDQSLRRAGRFDRELCIGVPDVKAREDILMSLTSKLRETNRVTIDCKWLAKRTPGYVGADLVSLVSEAGVVAVNRIFGRLYGGNTTSSASQQQQQEEMEIEHVDEEEKEEGEDEEKKKDEEKSLAVLMSEVMTETTSSKATKSTREIVRTLSPSELDSLRIDMVDFEAALKRVQPTAKREGFATVPGITWDDVGALHDIREELILSILKPIQTPEIFTRLGLSVPAGVLLYGPPGCGKTLLAKAIANESGANFIAVKGPELLDKYVGESEKAVRALFLRAQTSSPCIIFFDELDSLASRRGSGSGNGVSERVVNQLLTELDGLNSRRDVFVIGATNRPDILDPALLRPGRLDKLLYVPMPDESARREILRTLTRKTPLNVGDQNIFFAEIAKSPKCRNFSGADLQALVREAALSALRQQLKSSSSGGGGNVDSEKKGDLGIFVSCDHFYSALERVRPSVSEEDREVYETMRRKLRGGGDGDDDDDV